jgi:hypothetical protein
MATVATPVSAADAPRTTAQPGDDRQNAMAKAKKAQQPSDENNRTMNLGVYLRW